MKPRYLVMLLLLTSCASDGGTYPSMWASLRDDNSCLRISGVYANFGELDPEIQKHYAGPISYPRLSDMVLGDPGKRISAGSSDTVEITQRDSALYVRAMRGSEALVSEQYGMSSTSCNGGWLELSSTSGMPNGTGNVVLGFSKDSTWLHSASDGSLVVMLSSEGAGLAYLVVPVSGKTTAYRRFFPSSR
jgi:hypothetical protein